MNTLILVFLSAVGISNGRPNVDVSPQNMVTVPPNCPSGQEWVNGQCRDVWKTGFNPSNLVTVPPNCAAGQVYVNGQCRDVWSAGVNPLNVISVPPNCAEGQEYVNGKCTDIWLVHSNEQPRQRVGSEIPEVQVAMPSNLVTVPPNCPAGQEYVNGQCRDVWIKRASTLITKLVSDEQKNLNMRSAVEGENIQNETRETKAIRRNIISVPHQCPIGYKADALGVCRKIFEF